MSSLEQIDETYFAAWENGDFDTIRAMLADEVDFVGALGQARGVEEFLTGLRGLGQVLTRIEVRARLADSTDVMTWFNLHTSVAAPAASAKWTHIENGKITRIRVAFDPRDLLAGLEKSNLTR
ncbi:MULTISPECIES: nuclear transport factor 2 family protein [Streptomyces]|uniref:Nuclear transport factor 2 family protein n=1 Tax=Streptomyces ramulosus TaxID=47762 RepID=A0ABW1FD56_9ACTN